MPIFLGKIQHPKLNYFYDYCVSPHATHLERFSDDVVALYLMWLRLQWGFSALKVSLSHFVIESILHPKFLCSSFGNQNFSSSNRFPKEPDHSRITQFPTVLTIFSYIEAYIFLFFKSWQPKKASSFSGSITEWESPSPIRGCLLVLSWHSINILMSSCLSARNSE